MLSSLERHSCSSATYSIDKSTGCCYQWHGSSTVDKIFWSRYLFQHLQFPPFFQQLSASPHGLLPILSNFTKGGRQQRGTFIGLKMQIRGLATPVPRQWGKYLANPKKKGMALIIQFSMFYSLHWFLVHYQQFRAVAINICCI